MAITRYEPMSLFNQLQDEINQLVNKNLFKKQHDGTAVETSQWLPTVDIQETKDSFIISADLPGVAPKDIDVSMENGVLTIRGERKSETKEEANNHIRIERVYGTFYRRFSLPDTADSEKISAKSANGVLEIMIPKREVSKARRIKIE